jgi:uncharacterized protein (TIGR00730 family)
LSRAANGAGELDMSQSIRSVTVYCSSSRHVPGVYFEAARELGRAIATAGWTLVYGGNCVGCMAALADSAREAGGKVVGITPKLLVEQGIADQVCDELLVTSGMRDRKALMEDRGDAFIALPGGLGTFEEVFEIIVGRMLGFHQKPIVLLNVWGYYDPLLAMIEHGIEQRFIKASARDAFFVASQVGEAIEFLKNPTSGESSVDLSTGPQTSAIE